jgi:predicted DCC family thiol-disulfide oxidoreductase YuxK
MQRLAGLLREGTYEALSFQDPGVLERFPGITHERCMRAMILVDTDGRAFTGMEAAARAVGGIALLYYVPIVRQLLDLIYWLIARNRYRLMGKQVQQGACEGGTCALHLHAKKKT